MNSQDKLKKWIDITKKTLYIVISILILIMLWQVVAIIVDNPLILPTFGQACGDLLNELESGQFYSAFFSTLLRTIISFVISLAVAIILYCMAKISDFSKAFVQSLVSILRSIPTIAIILFLLLWTNSQIAPSVISILVIMPILFSGLQGMNIESAQKDMCKVFDIKGIDYFKFIYFPKVQTALVPVIASSVALNLKIMVAGEVLASTYMSLGGLMQSASVYFEMGRLLALAFITVIVAIILEKLISCIKYIHFSVKDKR